MHTRILILSACIVLLALGLWYWYDREVARAPEPVPAGENEDITFQYPELITSYIHPVSWPPTLTVSVGNLSCSAPKVINGRMYCVTATSEGAAGSVYTDYVYQIQIGDDVVSLAFALRMTQCANYDDPQKTQCEQERALFSPDELADQILQTVEPK